MEDAMRRTLFALLTLTAVTLIALLVQAGEDLLGGVVESGSRGIGLREVQNLRPRLALFREEPCLL